MTKKRTCHSATSKSAIALEAIRGKLTQAQLTSEYGVHPTQIKQWKQQGIKAVESCFSKKHEKINKAQDNLIEGLYQEIGQLHTQLNWLKKKQCKFVGEAKHD